MDKPTFRLVFKGDYHLDCDLVDVKEKISVLLKADQSKVETLFTGKAVTLKSGLSREEALKMKAIFDRTGGLSYVEPLVDVPKPIVTRPSAATEIPSQFQPSISHAIPVKQEPFTCPKCGFEQEKAPSCAQCGVFFHKITASDAGSRKGEAGINAASSGPVMDVKEERTWAMACHLSALTGFVIPFGNVIGPLLVWIWKKNGSEFVDEHGKISLNFQLTLTIFILGSLLISIVNSILLMILLPVFVILGFYSLIMIIISGAKANNGEYVEIPISSRIIK